MMPVGFGGLPRNMWVLSLGAATVLLPFAPVGPPVRTVIDDEFIGAAPRRNPGGIC